MLKKRRDQIIGGFETNQCYRFPLCDGPVLHKGSYLLDGVRYHLPGHTIENSHFRSCLLRAFCDVGEVPVKCEGEVKICLVVAARDDV